MFYFKRRGGSEKTKAKRLKLKEQSAKNKDERTNMKDKNAKAAYYWGVKNVKS